MKFGITLKPDISVERIVALTRQAEASGFEYGWIFDSHVLWKEPYPLLTLMANATRSMRLGPCVTNPAVRDLTVTASLFATLNLISGGRMELGIGRGDSSRRVMGKKPVTPAELERAVTIFRDLTAGQKYIRRSDGPALLGDWLSAGLDCGLRTQGLEPGRPNRGWRDSSVCRSRSDRVVSGICRQGAKEAGRDPRSVEVMAAAPVWVSDDLALARQRVRWFPALVSNHVVDLVSRYKPEDLPASLTSYVQDRPDTITSITPRWAATTPASFPMKWWTGSAWWVRSRHIARNSRNWRKWE